MCSILKFYHLAHSLSRKPKIASLYCLQPSWAYSGGGELYSPDKIVVGLWMSKMIFPFS